jgi:hypothetical protein
MTTVGTKREKIAVYASPHASASSGVMILRSSMGVSDHSYDSPASTIRCITRRVL